MRATAYFLRDVERRTQQKRKTKAKEEVSEQERRNKSGQGKKPK
jgi:hypothetical protein